MSRYQPFHDLPASQYEALKADIAVHGVLVPILVDEDGTTIDGHQRRRACAELKVDCPRSVLTGLGEDEKQALAVALNAFRRHLSGVERSQAIQQLKNLGWSQRRIAAAVGVSHQTVMRASGGPSGPPEGVDPATGEITDTSGSGGSQGEAAEPGVDGGVPVVPPRPSPAPNPRVTGRDGKSYPAKKADPDPAAEAEAKRKALVARISMAMKQAHDGLLSFDVGHISRCADTDLLESIDGTVSRMRAWCDAYDAEFHSGRKLKVAK